VIRAYYNEIDPQAAAWLRNLIAAGHIAPGDVDERSIEDVRPADLVGYRQCHFFAGVGIWSYALRRAGVPDDAPVWTGSCPCQPFSTAGEGAGFADERHLWPHFHYLIEQCGPGLVLGEQVASADADPWVDLVLLDLERLGYAFGAQAFPAAGVGAPHIRDRLYWVAHAPGARLEGRGSGWSARPGRQGATAERGGADGGLADTAGNGRQRRWTGQAGDGGDAARVQLERLHDAGGLADPNADGRTQAPGDRQHRGEHDAESHHAACGVANASSIGREWRQGSTQRGEHEGPNAGRLQGDDGSLGLCEVGNGSRRPGPTNGHWRAADWLLCRDGFWRPARPGTFPLVAGAPARVVRLRAYGNGLCAPAAEEFIRIVMEAGEVLA